MTILTGIFGGSFNPIHNGHTHIAQSVCESHLVDELWLMVSPQNPLKESRELLNENMRLHLAEVATRDIPGIHVSDFEFHLPKPSFTYNTMMQLEKAYPNRSFSLVIGADNWCDFDKWFMHDRLLQRYPIIIYPREGYDINKKVLPKNVHFIDMPLYPISATQIRNNLRNGQDISSWVHPEVAKKITSFLSKQ